MDRSVPCERAAWPRRRRATSKAENRIVLTRIDTSIQITPAALDADVRLIDTPGSVGRLAMTAQPRLQFGTVPFEPNARSSCGRLSARARSVTAQHRGARASTKAPRTEQRISSGTAFCRHLKITGRVALFAISSGYHLRLSRVTTQPRKLVHISNRSDPLLARGPRPNCRECKADLLALGR